MWINTSPSNPAIEKHKSKFVQLIKFFFPFAGTRRKLDGIRNNKQLGNTEMMAVAMSACIQLLPLIMNLKKV